MERTDYLATNVKFSYDLYSRFWSLSAFGGYFVQTAVLWGHAGCPLSGVERWPLLGGSKCTISMERAIGGIKICPLYGGCPLFGVSVIRGFTVIVKQDDQLTATMY